jgi:sulfonate transport system substrate-binding protein
MNMKLSLRLAAAVLAALVLLANVPHAIAREIDVLRVTYVASPFNVPSIVMRANGYLEETFRPLGIEIEWLEITSGAKQMQALAAGEIHIASVLGGTSAILGRAGGIDVRVIAVFSRNPAAFKILAMPDGPADVASLRGKKVAGPKGTVLHQLLAAALAKQGLRLTDVEHVNMDLPSARAALLAGSVDAATLAGHNALVIEQAGGRVLASGDGLIEPTTVIGVRGDLLENNPEIVEAYLAAHRKALEFMRSNPEAALQIAAAEQQLDLEDARNMMTYYDFFTPRVTDRDIANLSADQDFMVEAGMLTDTIDIRKDLIAPGALTLE